MNTTTSTPESLFESLRHVGIGASTCNYTIDKCRELAPIINRIQELKAEKRAVILAHSYVSPEIIYGVSDFSGDSYGLSKNAMDTDAKAIIFVAVRFMAETAKILNPDKDVYITATNPGCTLADSITGDDVRRLKREFPGYTMMCYINTTADVKAECDVCVTSSNVYRIVERYPSDRIYFLPDKLMGYNIIEDAQRRGIKKDIKLWHGTCYVHEEYDPDMVTFLRSKNPGLKVLSHPECSPGVLHESDFVGSTTQLLKYVRTHEEKSYLMLTECGLTARLQVELPDRKFVGSCTMCRYMKSNSLEEILRVMTCPEPRDRIDLDPVIMQRARRSIDAMFEYGD